MKSLDTASSKRISPNQLQNFTNIFSKKPPRKNKVSLGVRVRFSFRLFFIVPCHNEKIPFRIESKGGFILIISTWLQVKIFKY